MAEPMSLLTFFTGAVGQLGTLVGWMVRRRDTNREKVAVYFDQVAECLREIAARIEAGDAPRDTCRRLAVYATELERILSDRGYVTATGDVSIDETRLRLAGELEKAQVMWDPGFLQGRDPVELAQEDLSKAFVMVGLGNAQRTHGMAEATGVPAPTAEVVDAVSNEVADRFASGRGAQDVWDAAGEFKALADALRAR